MRIHDVAEIHRSSGLHLETFPYSYAAYTFITNVTNLGFRGQLYYSFSKFQLWVRISHFAW